MLYTAVNVRIYRLIIIEKDYILLSLSINLLYAADFELTCDSSAVSPSGPVSLSCNAANGVVSTVSCNYDNGAIVEDCKSTQTMFTSKQSARI